MHSKYYVFRSQERSKKCGGTSPNGIGLLGKDERRRASYEAEEAKEGKDSSKYRQQQEETHWFQKPTGSLVPSIIKSNSAMNVKTTTGGSNKSKDEIEILLRAREKMKQPGPGGQSHGGSERPRAGLARARRRGGAGRR
ncbi:unnamed protein product [Urochloa humidicola]